MDDEVLFERPLQVGTKRLYVDLRRNQQGVYLKLSEKGPTGMKNTIMLPASGLRELREVFDDVLQSTDGDTRNVNRGGAGAIRKKRDNSRSVNRSVYVSGLAWTTDWKSLKDYMREAGPVDHCSIMTSNGRSLGCGVVEFSTPEGAANAIANLNDTMLDGRKIHVREDRQDEDEDGNGMYDEEEYDDGASNKRRRVRRQSGYDDEDMDLGHGGDKKVNGKGVFVSNLSWSVSNKDLEQHMSNSGRVVRAEIMTGKNGRSIGCGVVEFATVGEAEAAIAQLNQSTLLGREIRVRQDVS